MDRSRILTILLILTLLFFLLSPTSHQPSTAPTALSLQKTALEQLRAATFATPPWPLPEASAQSAWQNLRTYTRTHTRPGPVYRNATGELHGSWYSTSTNTTGAHAYPGGGKIELTIEETTEPTTGDVQLVRVWVKLKTEDWRVVVDTHLVGVHFVSRGELVVASTLAQGWPGVMGVPWAADVPLDDFKAAKELLEGKVAENIAQNEGSVGRVRKQECEYTAWVKLLPVVEGLHMGTGRYMGMGLLDGADYADAWEAVMVGLAAEEEEELRAVEEELRAPTGQRVPATPALEANMVLHSKGCGLLLEAKRMVGEKVQMRYRSWRALGLGAALVAAAQMWVFARQIDACDTASTRTRVSLYMLVVMAVTDGFFAVVFGVAGIQLDPCFLALITACFGFLLLVSMFELRFISTIFLSAPRTPPPADTPLAGLPAPVTARTEPALTPEETTNHALNQLRLRITFLIFLSIILSVYATSLTPTYRQLSITLAFFASNSFLLPQIVHNITHNSRKPLLPTFLILLPILRLAPAAYLHLHPRNIFHMDPDPDTFALLAAWTTLQICVLAAQDMFGARFCVPEAVMEKGWDYHRVAVDEEEMRSGGDCAVCMGVVRVERGVWGRRRTAVTPCGHLFHTKCLDGWMRYRMCCPVCRMELPAV